MPRSCERAESTVIFKILSSSRECVLWEEEGKNNRGTVRNSKMETSDYTILRISLDKYMVLPHYKHNHNAYVFPLKKEDSICFHLISLFIGRTPMFSYID